METIPVQLKAHSYNILVGRKLLKKLPGRLQQLEIGQKILVIGDSNTRGFAQQVEHFLAKAKFDVTTATMPAGETHKTLDSVRHLYTACAKHQLDRGSCIVAVGGGVVGDVAGFVAATYLRGISVVQVATTVIAQVDSSIGGKTGVDLAEGKNLVGAFHQPALVVSDLDLLETLPRREFISGLAEVIKYGLIYDAELFTYLKKKLSRRPITLESESIVRCAAIKAEIVSKDAFETRGLRQILNYGHTLGHAIETAAGYGKLLHGEAISLGMLAASILSHHKLGLDWEEVERVRELLVDVGLPVKLPRELQTPAATQRMLKAMQLDKKTQDGKLQFVLLERIGRPKIKQEIDPEEIKEILSELK